ncbi:MAG TPA: tripartite tricarboxylate transporter TctB family protein, partial [Methylomirabilota bacterium]|nr:tripartite tricarboxylate transporter TctB family protein [Methylomirabilota bacterium]
MAERVLALALLLASGTYLTAALPLPRGTLARPGPGFFPLAVGAFACVIALGWTARAWCRPRAAGHATTPAEARQRVLATAACLVGFCLLLPW